MPNNTDEGEIVDGLLRDAAAAIAAGALNKAAAIYSGILALDPDHPVALAQFGTLAIELGRPHAALEPLRHAVDLAPTNPDLYHAIGTALRLMGKSDEAILAWEGALRVDPTFAPALHDSGLLLRERGEFDRAGEMFRRLALANANHFDAVFNRGIVLFQQDNLIPAERWFHQAARLDPADARPWINLAMIYRTWGFADRAIACLEHALDLAPDMVEAHWNLANARLLAGDYARGFAAYESRFRRPGFAERPFVPPRWRGEDPAGRTIMLWAEQGAGDIIQFARFAAPLAARGARVIIECPYGLESLIATAPGVTGVARWGTVPEGTDWVLPLLSTPHVLGTDLTPVPRTVPYLRVPAGTEAPRLTEPGFRIGVAWRGNPHHANDRNRSIALDRLAPLRAIPGTTWYSLQWGAGEAEARQGAWAGGMHVLSHHLTDFAVTAALVDQLDLVISVDTAVAHLAGALAKPVWTLIHCGNDWRWGERGSDTVWYPTMRLFRQAHPRNWQPPIAAMAEALPPLIAARAG